MAPSVSYAQNREDVVIYRVLSRKPNGFYIDVGANDPVTSSVTKMFYELGWRGINIEPVYSVFQRLAADRIRDVNLNVGISNCSKTLTFFECQQASTLSTFSQLDAEHRADYLGVRFVERKVPVMTLAQVCEQHVSGEIDFLSIDAEALEREVIEGHDWNRWRPRIVVIEDPIAPDTALQTHDKWEPLVLAAGYLFGLNDGINRFYIRKEDEALLPLLRVPANVEDNYVTYETVCLRKDLEAARARLALYGELGYAAVLARKLRNALVRHPLATSKRIVRLLLGSSQKSDAA
jgi:FkbM family methyltransferase